MKKSFALVLLLALITACAPPSTNTDVASNANLATNRATESASTPALSEADAIAKEKAVWDTIKNKDYEAFGNMLANDQVEVGPDTVYDKAGTMAAVREFEPSEITFSDWRLLPIDKDAVVVTYSANIKGKWKGKELPPETVRASSAWVNRDGKWTAMYHQECAVNTAPPPPLPAASSSPAKTTATPATTSSPATTGSDPIANEKALYDALKARNYDGFAALLAADSLEVEPRGVYDKAGSVKLVSQFDLSKAQLSEFKAVPFDSDTALVTYLVKLPGSMPAERHTTIWANRDGKWLAVFHHGTPVAKIVASSASPAAKSSPSPPAK